MAGYVEIRLPEFFDKMEGMGFDPVASDRMGSAKEYIFERPINERYTARIYSSISVHTNTTRQCGEDAIRVMLFDLSKERPIKVEKRVHRTKNALNNVHKRAREVWGYAINTDNQCPKCSSILVERKGPRGSFFGCSSYPDCTHTKRI
jgi:hypothetical protein